MASMDDFTIGPLIGNRQPGRALPGGVLQVTRRGSSEARAMKRIEVERGQAKAVLQDFTRSASLEPRSTWLELHADESFVHEYTDHFQCPRAYVCVVEELASRSLEQDIITRAVETRPFENLPALFASLLHGLQAFHAQGCLHRNLCSHSVFFAMDGRVRLGRPGPIREPPAVDYYPGGLCNAYSADIFALGLVFLEMALLTPLCDMAVTTASVLEEILALDGSAAQFLAWLEERSSLFLMAPIMGDLAEALAAMLCSPATARPCADDLLDLPVFAPYADALQVLPIASRPCVVMAHAEGVAFKDVPRRCLLALPWLHQLFSRQGSQRAMRDGGYRWSGRYYDLWWLEDEPLAAQDTTELAGLATEVPALPVPISGEMKPLPPLAFGPACALASSGGSDAVAALALSAVHHRREGRLIAAEVCYRAALAGLAGGASGSSRPAAVGGAEDESLEEPCEFYCEACGVEEWLGLAAILLERGNFSAARLVFLRAQALAPQEEKDHAANMASSSKLWGLCEFILAIDKLRRQRGEVPEEGPRSNHVALYYRSAVASDAGSWEALAALGEFYRLVGCPDPPFRTPAPDKATALSYLEQARGIEPEAPFVRDRLARLAAAGGPKLAVTE